MMEKLASWNYKVKEKPQKGDLALYFGKEEMPHHMGTLQCGRTRTTPTRQHHARRV